MAIIGTLCGANNVMHQICLALWTCDHNKWTVCSSLWASSVEFDFSPVCVLKCLLKCLKCLLTPSRVRGLFPGREPFWAGYGNKAWDILAYKVQQQTIYLCPSCFGFCRQSGSTQTGSSMCSRIARFLQIYPAILYKADDKSNLRDINRVKISNVTVLEI